jgi:predicted DsbA family dithiol-disulfide isomerase
MKALFEAEGLPYNTQRSMSYNSRLAQELAKWAETREKSGEIHDALFRAYFVDLKNIGNREVLAGIAETLGLPREEAIEALVSRSFKRVVDEDWKRCAELGVTAVPTFLTNHGALVGAYPYEELEKLVRNSS